MNIRNTGAYDKPRAWGRRENDKLEDQFDERPRAV